MFKRFFRYMKALIMGKLDQWEDPEVILDQASREMKEMQIKNRERAVQAITQKNNLQNLVANEEKLTAGLERRAATALQNGNRELARQLLHEKGLHDKTLEQLRASLKQAEETSEAVKVALRREDERIRVRTAEALALKANMKQAQIQIAMNKALDGMQLDDTAQSWDRAAERIETMKSEASARAEIAKTSVNARIEALDDIAMDADTDAALAALEAKMGLAPAGQVSAPATATTQAAGVDPIEQQLQELEAKLGKQS